MSKPTSEFEKAAARESQGGFFRELWGFLRSNKKWWLLPIVVVLLIFGVLVLLTSTGVAPFIYSFF